MKKLFFLTPFLFTINCFSQKDTSVKVIKVVKKYSEVKTGLDTSMIIGIYTKNICLLNGPDPKRGNGMTIKKVLLNGKPTTDEINSSAFEIDLEHAGLKIGDTYEIKIISVAQGIWYPINCNPPKK